VRRIIELALPRIVQTGGVRRVTLAVGEAGDRGWIDGLRSRLDRATLRVVYEPSFRYFSEQRLAADGIIERVRCGVRRLLDGDPASMLVWAHNLGLARNLILSDQLARECERRGVTLVSHHHDFWFENRWRRWEEMRAGGFRTLARVAEATFARGQRTMHATINQFDNKPIQKAMDGHAAWLPNLSERSAAPSQRALREAKRWLADRLGERAPIWIVPCRLLRRKNLAEAILLARWLRPEAWLVTTGGISSVEERPYGRRLMRAAKRHGWRARLGLLADAGRDVPSMDSLVCASEAVVLTSVQEGFGLPYLEAAAAGRPLLARRLDNVLPDLEKLGLSLPHLYDEVWIDPALIDREMEAIRQRTAWDEWRRSLPSACRAEAEPPVFLTTRPGEPVAFSRLSLSGQLEVLAVDSAMTWRRCREWNPALAVWKDEARAGQLRAAEWPEQVEREIGGESYARRFWEVARVPSDKPPSRDAVVNLQRRFIEERLSARFIYPILLQEAE
jgi:glycosyltransferase involved in cell wall biosynthesis